MPQRKDGVDFSQPRYQELATGEENGNTVVIKDILDDEQDASAQCGLGGLRCRCLQVLAHPNAYVLMVGLLFMAVVGASGMYLSGVISTIEKRFQLKSSESGVLMAMNDISSLSVLLFVTHFGGRSHRPRIVGISGLIVAVGTFVTALPQFIYDNPVTDELFVSGTNQSEFTPEAFLYEKEFVCNARANATPCTAEEIDASGSQLSKAWPIILGQLLCGVGTSAIVPLSMTYIDDAVEKTIMPIYIALMFLPMAIAPLFGYSISGYCLSHFVDFYKTDVSELGITPRDPQWQGAWWLGFIIYGFLLCLFSIPFFFFPRKMDKPKSYFCIKGVPDCCKGLTGRVAGGRGARGATMTTATHKKAAGKPMAEMKEFLASLWRLFTNPTFMCALIGFCMVVMSFVGFGLFSAKYIQFEFGVAPSKAGLLLSFSVMPGSLVGILLGGMVSSRVARSNRGYALLTISVQSLCVLTYGIMMSMGCSNIDIAGLTTQYGASSHVNGNSLDIYSSCNVDCSCEKGVYSPVCGSDQTTYVTACFAGCQTVSKDEDDKTLYEDCSCINATGLGSPNDTTSGFAYQGACASSCNSLWTYVVFVGIATAISSFAFNPTFMMKFRSVLDKDRDLSLGLSSLLSKTLGFIPVPVIVGATIETQCAYWQESCDATGECLLYDRTGLRFAFLGFTAGFRFLAVLCFCVGTYFVFMGNTHKPGTDEKDGATENGKGTNDGGITIVEKKETDF